MKFEKIEGGEALEYLLRNTFNAYIDSNTAVFDDRSKVVAYLRREDFVEPNYSALEGKCGGVCVFYVTTRLCMCVLRACVCTCVVVVCVHTCRVRLLV